MAFTQKVLEVSFDLAQGNFQGGGNSHLARGLRITADIVKAGGASMGAAQIAIYGMPLSVMNQLSTFGMTLTLTGKNSVTIKAGERGGQMTTVFQGTIASAAMDGQAQPNVAFHVEAYASAYENAKPVEPTSMPGSQDVKTLMQTIAQKAGLQFEGNGIDGKIMNPYLPGTAVQQMHALARAARIERIIDCGTLAVWKPGGSRQGGGATVSKTYSPQTGLVAYPTFNSQGIVFRCLWDPGIQYGSEITIQSSMTPACGKWVIYKLEYALSCQTPNGPWFCDVWAHRPGVAPVA